MTTDNETTTPTQATNDRPPTPLEASIAECRAKFNDGVATLTRWASIAPGLHSWDFSSGIADVSLKLLQGYPGAGLPKESIQSQTSAINIFLSLGIAPTCRCDGSFEGRSSDGWMLILHGASAEQCRCIPPNNACTGGAISADE